PSPSPSATARPSGPTTTTRGSLSAGSSGVWLVMVVMLRREHDLADVRAGLDELMRLGHLVEWVAVVNDGSDPPGVDEGPRIGRHGRDDLGLLRRWTSAQRGRRHGGTATHQLAQVELGASASLHPDDHEAAVDGECIDVVGEIL